MGFATLLRHWRDASMEISRTIPHIRDGYSLRLETKKRENLSEGESN